MLLTIFETPFGDCKFIIDPSTLSFESNTEDYEYNDPKSLNKISFVLKKHEETEVIFEELKKKFRYIGKPEFYVAVRTTFSDYEQDKRPRLYLFLRNGSKGIRNPLSFHLRNQEP